ncbi:uncharacterized protein CLUP02_11350 [Colletotrichum lupini]|uniref:Uncharacterized protein n=1 Tax=Colletotrichum lupini TaxID=145971 RepID=A0A9Q8WJR5_9PEZI|nr:uncharacterized protein CLUP02_11350 [Colletotrichum lupini]UQC85851.1 hypothetical protein CLUP02_11350 [Colletotrichum lupini]
MGRKCLDSASAAHGGCHLSDDDAFQMYRDTRCKEKMKKEKSSTGGDSAFPVVPRIVETTRTRRCSARLRTSLRPPCLPREPQTSCLPTNQTSPRSSLWKKKVVMSFRAVQQKSGELGWIMDGWVGLIPNLGKDHAPGLADGGYAAHAHGARLGDVSPAESPVDASCRHLQNDQNGFQLRLGTSRGRHHQTCRRLSEAFVLMVQLGNPPKRDSRDQSCRSIWEKQRDSTHLPLPLTTTECLAQQQTTPCQPRLTYFQHAAKSFPHLTIMTTHENQRVRLSRIPEPHPPPSILLLIISYISSNLSSVISPAS